MKQIKLTRGQFAIVDDDVFDELSKHNWYIGCDGYAGRNRPTDENGKRGVIRMHRVVINATPNLLVDHINGNKLDNRKTNLRLATQAQNTRNRRVRCDNALGLKGVCLHKQSGKFMATIMLNGNRKYLGLFESKELACLAYDDEAKKLFGEFALTNEMIRFQH